MQIGNESRQIVNTGAWNSALFPRSWKSHDRGNNLTVKYESNQIDILKSY
jgi:hypothetical protein